MTEWDATHTGPTTLVVNTPWDEGFEVQHDKWAAPHFGTVGYHPDLMTHVFADGRFIVRGGWGIHCYDLREDSATHTSPAPIKAAAETRFDVRLVAGNLKVEIPQGSNAEIRLLDASWRTVYTALANRSSLKAPLSGRAAGVYTLMLTINGKRHVRRIVKP